MARRTSPSRRRILKLRLLILRVGELGKQFRQLPKDEMRSKKTCAMAGGLARGARLEVQLEAVVVFCCRLAQTVAAVATPVSQRVAAESWGCPVRCLGFRMQRQR